MTGPSTHDTDRPLIYHVFADVGVESEPLSVYGRVVRVGLDPLDTNDSEPVKADARNLPLKPGADLAVLHPPCQRWAPQTHISGDRDEHPNFLPLARRIGEEYAEDYIIENVPTAPLEDPTVLDGRMFGLPVAYRRAFETTFQVDVPPAQATLADGGAFATHSATGNWNGDARLWRTVKQVAGDYPARDMKRSGIPAPYIHHLIREWMEQTAVPDETDTEQIDGGDSA